MAAQSKMIAARGRAIAEAPDFPLAMIGRLFRRQ